MTDSTAQIAPPPPKVTPTATGTVTAAQLPDSSADIAQLAASASSTIDAELAVSYATHSTKPAKPRTPPMRGPGGHFIKRNPSAAASSSAKPAPAPQDPPPASKPEPAAASSFVDPFAAASSSASLGEADAAPTGEPVGRETGEVVAECAADLAEALGGDDAKLTGKQRTALQGAAGRASNGQRVNGVYELCIVAGFILFTLFIRKRAKQKSAQTAAAITPSPEPARVDSPVHSGAVGNGKEFFSEVVGAPC
jgi:hypothetical protein